MSTRGCGLKKYMANIWASERPYKIYPPPVPGSYRMAGDEHLSRFLSHGYLRIGEGRADPDFRSGVQVFDRLTRVIS